MPRIDALSVVVPPSTARPPPRSVVVAPAPPTRFRATVVLVRRSESAEESMPPPVASAIPAAADDSARATLPAIVELVIFTVSGEPPTTRIPAPTVRVELSPGALASTVFRLIVDPEMIEGYPPTYIPP